MTRAAALLLVVLAVGCGGAVGNKLSPLEGYAKTRPDAPPFDAISATCREQAAFHDARGTSWTDWQQFEDCMNQHGWERAPEGEPRDAGASGAN